MRRRALLALRRYGAVSRVMGRIWIAMGMGWGVSRGGDDAVVALKRTSKRNRSAVNGA